MKQNHVTSSPPKSCDQFPPKRTKKKRKKIQYNYYILADAVFFIGNGWITGDGFVWPAQISSIPPLGVCFKIFIAVPFNVHPPCMQQMTGELTLLPLQLASPCTQQMTGELTSLPLQLAPTTYAADDRGTYFTPTAASLTMHAADDRRTYFTPTAASPHHARSR